MYNPKTIFVGLPALALLIGYLCSQVRWWPKGVVLVLVAGGLTLGTIKALDPSYRRAALE